MTIRKVSGATSGLVTKAELVVSAPFIGKAVVTQQQLLATARTDVDIIKVAAQQPSTINRLLYDDEGGASRLLRSFLLIGDADPLLLIGKTFNDILSATELLELIKLQLGRVLADSIEAQAPRPAFVLSRPLQDQTSIADPRQLTLNKNLADVVGMLDDFSLGDGNVFDLGLFRSDQILMDQQLLLLAAFNRIFQEDTAQLDRTSLQFGFNAADVIQVLESIFITRLITLLDDTAAADTSQLNYNKNLNDFFAVLSLAGVGDGNVFNFGLNVPAETLTIDQSHSKFIGKASTDSTDIVDFDQRVVAFQRVFEDITTMLDLIGVGDGSEFFLQLPQSDAVDIDDAAFNLYWTALRSFEHGVDIFDVQTLQYGKNTADSLELADPKSLSISKNFSDAFTALSLAGIGDGINYFFASFVNDIVAATDPAFSLLFSVVRQPQDTVAVVEQSARDFSKAILTDSAAAEQQLQFVVLKQLVSGEIPAVDVSTLSVALNRQDLILMSDTEPTRNIFKALLDIGSVAEQREFIVLKTADAEEQVMTDFFARRFDVVRGERDGFADFSILESLTVKQVGKLHQEDLFYNDVFARLFIANRSPEENVDTPDQVFKFETRTPFDDMQAADQRVALLASKTIFDTTTMLDLAGVGDGNIFRLSMDKIEIQPVNEFYARRIRFRRRARDGFLDDVPILDRITILLPLLVGDPPGFDGVTIVQLDEQSAGRRDLRLFTDLGRFEDVPAEQLFYRQVAFFRFPHHNEAEAAAAGSDGFGNLQPMSDESPFGPAPAKYLQTFIPSPTKSDTTSVEVKAGGVSSTATNFVIFSERVGDNSYWNPGLRSGVNVTLNAANGPDGSTLTASRLSATGAVAESYIGYEVSSIANLASIVPNRTYYFSVWLRAQTTSTPIRLAADINGSTVNFGASNAAVTNLTTSWTRVELAFTPLVNNPRVFIGTTASSGNWGDPAGGGLGDNILAWGAQVSEFSSSTYVKTLADPFTGVSVAQRMQPGLEQTYWFVDLDAKAGVSYNVRNKFIDWVIPANQKVRNSGLQNSSTLVNFTSRDRDSVGIIDSSLTYVYDAGRFGFDELLIGRQDGDPGYRLYGANAETTRFFFNKRGTLFDGGTSAAIVGLPFGFRVSDSDQERLSYFLTTRMRRGGTTTTTSGVTDLFSTTLDPVYVGQRSPWQGAGVTVTSTLQTRRSGDQNENFSFLLAHPTSETTIVNTSRFQLFPQIRLGGNEAERSSSLVILGIPDYGFRVSDTLLEQTKFVLLQTSKQGVDQTVVGFGTSITTFAGARGSRVYVGDPTAFAATTSIQTRRSGSTLENTSYWFDKNAKRGVAGATTISTIDATPDLLNFSNSSVSVSRTALDLDDVGALDSLNVFYASGRRINDIVIAGSDTGFRVYDPGINPETVKFFFIKGLSDTVPMLDLTGIFDGLNSFITILKNEQTTFGRGTTNVAYPERRSGTDLERVGVRLEKTAQQGVARTFSSNTVTAQDLERIFVGAQDGTGFRVSGEPLENVRYFFIKAAAQDTPDNVILGIPEYGFRVSDTLLEQTKFVLLQTIKQGVSQTVTGFGTSITTFAGAQGSRVYVGDPTAFAATTSIQTRRSGSTLENTSYWFDKNAKRGVAGSTRVKTIEIDPYPLLNALSSVLVSRTALDLDDVGVYDQMDIRYSGAQRIFDLVTIGSDQGFRVYDPGINPETVKFFFIKGLTDTVPMLDLTGIFDGLNSFITVFKAEQTTFGRGTTNVAYPERRSGTDLERVSIRFEQLAKQGVTRNFSSNTITAADLERLYVGAQDGTGFRVSGEPLENVRYFMNKAADQDTPAQVVLGIPEYGFRVSDTLLEQTKFVILQTIKQGTSLTVAGFGTSITTFAGAQGSRVYVGDPTAFAATTSIQTRRSGTQLENISYWFDKNARRGVAGATTISTIDATPDLLNFSNSSVSVVRSATDLDDVGALDSLNVFYASGRRVEDLITIGTDAGFRVYDPGVNPETVKFFFIKGLSDTVPMLDLTGIFDGLNSFITIFKAEQTTFGRGHTSNVYPERRSGTDLERISMRFELPAKQGVDRTFSSNAVTAQDLERIYIGTQEPFGFRVSGENLENVRFFMDKDADQDTPAQVVLGIPEYGFRVSDSLLEQTNFVFNQLAKQGVNYAWTGFNNNSSFATTAAARGDQVIVGDPLRGVYPLRRSGNTVENVSYFFEKNALRGVAGSTTISTIDPTPDLLNFSNSSVAIVRSAADLDDVGALDSLNLFYLAQRIISLDSVLIGGDQLEEFDRFSGTSLENISYFMLLPKADDAPAGTANIGNVNLLRYSENFSFVSGAEGWARTSAVTVTANDVTYEDPLGGFTASRIQSTSNNSYVGQELTTSSGLYTQYLIANRPMIFSVWLRANTGSSVGINLSADLNASTINFGASTSITVIDSWQRYWLTFTPSVAVPRVFIGGGSTFTNGETVYAWGAQLNFGRRVPDYVATTTTPYYENDRYSGDVLENVSYEYVKRAKRGVTSTTSGVTDLFTADLDPVYIGQRTWQGFAGGARRSGDQNENISYFKDKQLNSETALTERHRFFNQLRLSRAPAEITGIVLGRGTTDEVYPERRSGDSLDNPAFLVRLDAKQSEETVFTGAFTSVTTRSRDRDRIFIGDPSLAPRRSGTTLENISYFYDKPAKLGRANHTVPVQLLPGFNGQISSVITTSQIPDTDLVGTLSFFREATNYVRLPHYNTFDDVAGAFDDSALPGDDSTNSPYPVKLLLKRAYLDDGSNGTSHAVKAGADTVVFGNLIDNSEDFTSTRWVNFVTGASSGVVITTGVADPDGGTSATQLTATRANSALAQYTLGSTVGAVSGILSTYSIWMRHPSSTVGINLYVDLDGAGANPTVVTSLTVTNSWRQYQLNFTPTTSNPVVWIGGGSTFSTGETVIVWHPQVNYGRDPTPYVATTGSPILLTTQSRYSGDEREIVAVFFDKSAKRSVAGTVQLNTIDPNPDVEFAVSSVLVSRTALDLDEVGTIDQFSLTYLISRFLQHEVQAGSGIDQRQDLLERISFVITKLISGDGSEILDLVGVADGNIVSFGLSKRDTQVIGSGQTSQTFPARTRDSLENISYFLDKNALQGNATSRTVSGVTTTAVDTDRLFVGQQYGDIRLSGDPLERLFYRAETRLGNSRNDAVATETVPLDAERYFLAKRANLFDGGTSSVVMGRERTNQPFPERRSGDSLDNPAFFVTLTAYRGTTGNLIVNTIDPNPDVEFAVSSVAIVQGTRSVDAVGMLDQFNLNYLLQRLLQHQTFIGSGEDFRFSLLERTNFFVGKRLGSETPILDLTDVFDGLNYAAIINKANVQIIGTGQTSQAFPARARGGAAENTAFRIELDARQGVNRAAFSGTTVLARDTDRLFVGQQYGDIRLSGDPTERTLFRFEKTADQDSSQTVQAGSAEDRRTADLEQVQFTLMAKRANPDGGEAGSSHLVIVGRERTNQTYPERRSGDQLDNTAFFVAIDAKRATSSGSITVKTIDSAGENRFSSTSITYGSLGPRSVATDAVGVWDYMFTTYDVRRTFEHAVLLGSSDDFRYSTLENTRFFVGKRLGLEYGLGSSNVILGHGLDQARGNDLEFLTMTLLQRQRDDQPVVDRSAFSPYPARFFSLDAKQSVLTNLSSTTVQARDREVIWVGQQSWQGNAGGFRVSGDRNERTLFRFDKLADQDSSQLVQAGSAEDRRSADLEQVRFTLIGKRATLFDGGTSSVVMGRGTTSVAYPERRSGDSLDNPAFTVNLTAYRGVGGNLTLNTIDPNPDVEFAQSSVTIAQGTRSIDAVGMLDLFSLFYAVGRIFEHDVTIGSGIDQRQTTLERISFLFRKLISDGSEILDLTDIFDGLNYSSILIKREVQSISDASEFSPYPARFFSKDAKAGATRTVSSQTALATSTDRLFVGQQFGDRRLSGDLMERVAFNVTLLADPTSSQTVQAGSGQDFRYEPLERTNFFVNKRGTLFDGGTSAAVMVDVSEFSPYPARFFSLDAKKGVSSLQEFKTIDPIPGVGDQSSTQVLITAATRDIVGIIDYYNSVFLDTGRRFFDTIIIGSGEDSVRGNDLEFLTFFAGKRLGAEYDVGSSTVLLGGAEDRRSAELEPITFFIGKRANLFDGGTSAAIMVENPALFYAKTAQLRGTVPVNQAWYSPVSAVTGLAHTAYRHTDTEDPVFVGSLGYKNSADILSNSSTTAVWVQQTITGQYTSGSVYTLSAYLRRLENNSTSGIAFDIGTTSFSITATSVTVTANTVWARYSTRFIAPRTSITIRIRSLGSNNNVDDLEIFGVQINSGNTVTSYVKTTTAIVAANRLLHSEDLDNAAWTKSSNTIVYANVTEAPTEFWAGTDWARPGDSQEKLTYQLEKTADQDSSALVQAGSGEDRRNADLERVRFTLIGKRATLFDGGTSSVILGRGDTSVAYPERRIEDSLENVTIFFAKNARRGTTGNLTLNTIDPNPDVEFAQSSVTVGQGTRSIDAVGMLDLFSLFYSVDRIFQHSVTIGSGSAFRYSPLERTRLFVGKRLGQDDGSEILDLTDVFDGLRYTSVLNRRETLLIGNGSSASQTFPARAKSGDGEIVGFDFSKTAQIRGTVGVNQAWGDQFSSTVGIATSPSRHTDTLDPVFVGSLGYKNSADILSNSSLTSVWVQQTIVGQYTSGSVYTLSGYFRRPSGVSTDIAMDVGTTGFSITATSVTRSVTGDWQRLDVRFIAPRTSITVRIRSLDTGGTDTLEVFGVQINSGNTVTSYVKTTTAIVAANRLLHSEDLENAAWVKSSNTIVYANIAEAPSDFWASEDWARPGDSQEKLTYQLEKTADQDSSQLVQIGGDQIEGADRVSDTTLERISYLVGKRATLDDGTNQNTEPVTIGRGTTNEAYPERRSGEELENFIFFFEKTAKQGSATTTVVSGTTVTAASPDRIFVGQQTWQGFAAGARRSGDRNELIQFDVSKDGIAEDREILEDFTAVWFARLNDGVGQLTHDTPATDFIVINNLKDHFDDAPTEDVPMLEVVKALGAANLEGTDDINNVSTAGFLRNNGYADIDYFDQDYVGDSRTLF